MCRDGVGGAPVCPRARGGVRIRFSMRLAATGLSVETSVRQRQSGRLPVCLALPPSRSVQTPAHGSSAERRSRCGPAPRCVLVRSAAGWRTPRPPDLAPCAAGGAAGRGGRLSTQGNGGRGNRRLASCPSQRPPFPFCPGTRKPCNWPCLQGRAGEGSPHARRRGPPCRSPPGPTSSVVVRQDGASAHQRVCLMMTNFSKPKFSTSVPRACS